MYAIYAYIGVVWGVNVGIYGSPISRVWAATSGLVPSIHQGKQQEHVLVRAMALWYGSQCSL